MMDELPIVTRLNENDPYDTPAATANLCAEAADLISELAEALRALIPTNVCDNPNIENDYNFPCDITMGELRQAWDAIAKATQ